MVVPELITRIALPIIAKSTLYSARNAVQLAVPWSQKAFLPQVSQYIYALYILKKSKYQT
jgi:hypothetical protein